MATSQMENAFMFMYVNHNASYSRQIEKDSSYSDTTWQLVSNAHSIGAIPSSVVGATSTVRFSVKNESQRRFLNLYIFQIDMNIFPWHNVEPKCAAGVRNGVKTVIRCIQCVYGFIIIICNVIILIVFRLCLGCLCAARFSSCSCASTQHTAHTHNGVVLVQSKIVEMLHEQ